MQFTKANITKLVEEHTKTGKYLTRKQAAYRLGINLDNVKLVMPKPDKTLAVGGQKAYLYLTERVEGLL